MFEAIARIIREAKMLGLFSEGKAHEIFTVRLSEVFRQNELEGFDQKMFEEMAGILPIVTTEELTKLLAPVGDYDETYAEVMTEVLRDCD